jgi:hypothetical protein
MNNPTQENWLRTALGRSINVDGMYGLQCKDVIDDYCLALFGDWINTIRPGDAAVCFAQSNPDYFDKIKNDPKNAFQVPERGDIVIWGSMKGNSAGHIAVVEVANSKSVTVLEQDGFDQVPTRRRTHPYVLSGATMIGWLRPKQNKIIGGTPQVTPIEDFRNCFYTLARRPANANEEKAWVASGMEPYDWCYYHGHFPMKEDRDAQLQLNRDLSGKVEALQKSVEAQGKQIKSSADAAKLLQDQVNELGLTVEAQTSTMAKQRDTIMQQEETIKTRRNTAVKDWSAGDLVAAGLAKLIGK